MKSSADLTVGFIDHVSSDLKDIQNENELHKKALRVAADILSFHGCPYLPCDKDDTCARSLKDKAECHYEYFIEKASKEKELKASEG